MTLYLLPLEVLNISIYLENLTVKLYVFFAFNALIKFCVNLILFTVWANFTLGSNSVKGKARPNILYEEI